VCCGRARVCVLIARLHAQYTHLIERCWHEQAAQRPSFDAIVHALLDMRQAVGDRSDEWERIETPDGVAFYRNRRTLALSWTVPSHHIY
jgi:hypothetical protein